MLFVQVKQNQMQTNSEACLVDVGENSRDMRFTSDQNGSVENDDMKLQNLLIAMHASVV